MQGGSARARRAVVVVAGVDLVSKLSETSYSRDAFIHPLRLVAKSSNESRQFVLGRFADFGVLAGSLPRTPTSFSRLRIASMAPQIASRTSARSVTVSSRFCIVNAPSPTRVNPFAANAAAYSPQPRSVSQPVSAPSPSTTRPPSPQPPLSPPLSSPLSSPLSPHHSMTEDCVDKGYDASSSY